MKKVSMQDIANKLSVSKVTVSKAFKTSNDISAAMRESVLKTANELGYVYSSSKRRMVGILTSSLFLEKDESFYTRIYKTLTEDANRYDLQLLLNIVNDSDQENCKLPYILESQSVDAIIVLGQLQKEFVKTLLKLDIPILLLDFYYRGMSADTVICDNYQASYEITSHLIDYGHTQIGFLGNIKSTTSIQDRYLGYVKALLENDIELDNSFLMSDRDAEQNFITLDFPKNLPTAYVCNNDHTAYMLIKELQKLGYKVPNDISVVGFDDLYYSEYSDPKLTTVKIDRQDMARIALKRVSKRIMNKDLSLKRFVTNARCIYRDSVKKVK